MGLLDLFSQEPAGAAGLLSPQDHLMALFAGLSKAGQAMSQPGLNRRASFAQGLGAIGPGMQEAQQAALMQNIMLGNVQQQMQQRKAQQDYISSLPPDQQKLALANPAEYIKSMVPKRAEIPFGASVGPDGRVSLMPGMTDYLGGRSAAEAGGKTVAERNAQNAVPLITDQPEFKARVAGAETGARQAAELPFVGPRAQAQANVDLNMRPQIAAATAQAENPALINRSIQIAQGTGQTLNNQMNNAGKLRDDFNALPTVKAYRDTIPVYQSMQEAAGRDSKAADLNLVYGLAKIMDPNSVVREGEMVMVNNTSSLPDWLVGTINGLNGGQRLQPETRKNIMQEAGSRVGSYKAAHDYYAEQFGQMADRAGLNRRDVLLETQAPAKPVELPTQGYAEGTIITGPRGEQKIMRSGKWVDVK